VGKRVSVIIILGLCLSGLFVYRYIASDQEVADPPAAISEEKADPGMYFKDVVLIGRRSGYKQWQIDASMMVVGEGENEAAIKDIGSGMIFQDGEPTFHFTGQEGIWNRRTDDFRLLGQVEITTEKEERFLTDGMQYNSSKGTFTSSGPVVAYIGENQLNAERMEGDLSTKQLSISGHVEIKQGEKQRILADHVVYDSEEQAVELFGNVRLELKLGADEEIDA
jgi:LPS export ABC transporter protein LptC